MDQEMKYVVLLGDGMADRPIESLEDKTPLQYAQTQNMDRLAAEGLCGMVRTVPRGMNPGSDTANLSVFGYDPSVYYTGRAPLEALNMDIQLGPKDVAFRCNIVTVRDGIMQDFSGGHIDTDFTRTVIEELVAHSDFENIEFYPGVSYRNIIVWRDYPFDEITETTPPHDISDREVAEYLPSGSGSDLIRRIMEKAEQIISASEKIADQGSSFKGDPTSVWIWGGGRKPVMESLEKRFGLHGYTISAVDLIHGIGRAAGLEPIRVKGATGYIDTNYSGKAQALLEALNRANFIYLHVEAPDESGHEGNLDHKLQSIQDFDSKVVGPVLDGLAAKYEHYAVLIMPDHPTPISIKTHSDDPVPFCMYRTAPWKSSEYEGRSAASFSEEDASKTGIRIEEGHRLIELMINGKL